MFLYRTYKEGLLTLRWAEWGKKKGSYWIYNSVWGAKKLKMNEDFRQSVNVDPLHFPNRTSLTWNYPHPGPGQIYGYGHIYAFPEIVFGQNPREAGPYMPQGFGLVAPQIKRVDQFKELSVKFDISVGGDSFAKYNNVAFDLWLTPDKSYKNDGRLTELFIGLHLRAPCGGEYSYRLSVSSFAADVWWLKPDKHRKWPLICFDPGRDVYSGNIVISDIFADLIKHGVITSEQYIGGIELGAEPGGGIGTVVIKKFSVTWD